MRHEVPVSNKTALKRREVLALVAAGACGTIMAGMRFIGSVRAANDGDESFEVRHSDAEWRARLTPAQYDVLRRQGTEYPFSSPLDHETRHGT
jgi:peptide-methionine (R)-S-oxide reductase